MISQKAKYALKALIAMAKAGDGAAMSITEIAEAQRIPKKFLEQILLEMKRDGILFSQRGKNGGYSMRLAPGEITFGRVLRLIDGPIAPLPCLSKIAYRRCEDCADEKACELRMVLNDVAKATRAVLDKATIADALAATSQAS
jgi:Rrf2 family protein